MQRQTKKKRNLEKGDWKLDPKTDWIVRGCSGEEGEPRWKLLELKLKNKMIRTSAPFLWSVFT